MQKELSEWDQDAIDALSLHNVAKQLLNKSLLLHKDKHIKALVAASFVDILRLCAPDAPYTLQELKVGVGITYIKPLTKSNRTYSRSYSDK